MPERKRAAQGSLHNQTVKTRNTDGSPVDPRGPIARSFGLSAHNVSLVQGLLSLIILGLTGKQKG